MVDSEAMKAGCPHTTSPEPCSICKAGDELAENHRKVREFLGTMVSIGRLDLDLSLLESMDKALKAYRKARGK